MATKAGKTPIFPSYIPTSVTHRNLFVYENHACYNKAGDKTAIVDYDDLVAFLFRENALLFVDSLTSKKAFPWLREAVEDDASKVSCQKKGKAVSITVRKARTSRKIIPISTWDKDASLDTSFLKHMDQLYQYCGVGVHGTPGGLGKALMLLSWKEYGLARHYAPSLMAQRYLWQYHVGGRCDTPGLGLHFDRLVELDMSSAYLAHFQIHPDGTAAPFTADAGWRYHTFFGECEVEIPHELALGPFPMRIGKQYGGRIVYPTLRGVYRAYLWREQAEDCINSGCTVRLIRGYGWKACTFDNGFWAKDTYLLRTRAYHGPLESRIKDVIVAGIGRHGMHGEFYALVPRPLAPEDKNLPNDDHTPSPFFIHKEVDHHQAAMTHWYSYTIMQTARSLYRYSLPYAEQGRLIMTNYDALLVTEIDESYRYPQKHTLAAQMAEAGDLRWQRLLNVDVLAPRSLECDVEMPDGRIVHRRVRPGVKV